jgi:hypothetical protein
MVCLNAVERESVKEAQTTPIIALRGGTTMKGFILGAVVAVAASAPAHAAPGFGFTPDVTKQGVEAAAAALNLGAAKWFGASYLVQGQDNYYHSWIFNFCNDKLYEVSQQFPANFEQMANFVDTSIQQYGQPIIVSAMGGMGQGGFIRPLNLYWKIDGSTYMRLMQLATNYTVIYQWVNSCEKVPR